MAYINITGNKQLDFQLNRILTYGAEAGSTQEIIDSFKQVRDIQTWFEVWYELAHEAEKGERWLHAAYYYRMAEFYLSDKDAKKMEMYEKSIHNFWKVIALDPSVQQDFVPYQGKKMKTMIFTPENVKATIVMFGGYDSFIEEFYLAVKEVVGRGFKVVLFEGPGQGYSLKQGLHFEHRWELPVKAVLDYFQIQDASLVGISWGGYLALRAAAFEKRIKNVVAYDVLYKGIDFMLNQFPPLFKILFLGLFHTKQSLIINRLMRHLMKKKLAIDWALSHGMYITGTHSPYDYFNHLKKHDLESHLFRIESDVLLLAGQEDHYIPLYHFYRIMQGLKNAKSSTGRIFTKSEGGEQHCQIGNHQLAIDEIAHWLERRVAGGTA